MALIQSKYAIGTLMTPFPAYAGHVIAKRFLHTFIAAPALNDILELAPIPPECRVLDMILTSTDMDSGGSPAILLDVGVMSGAWQDPDSARTCGAEFFSASNIAQAGGMARPTLRTAFEVAPASTYRSIGVKINTAAATFVAGTLGLTVFFATD